MWMRIEMIKKERYFCIKTIFLILLVIKWNDHGGVVAKNSEQVFLFFTHYLLLLYIFL